MELKRKLQDVECEATEETKSSRRHGSKRRSRAAEVHNQSERVRSESDATCVVILLQLSKVACCLLDCFLWCNVICAHDAEAKGPDQRKDAVVARTHTPLQQGKK